MPYVLRLDEVDASHVAVVGGKAANLGEVARIEGVRVPPGFCVTTDAFRRVMVANRAIADGLDRLSPDNAADLRRAVELSPIPDGVATDIGRALDALDADAAYAVRSSATAEDLPSASFAGQQDTYLNVAGLTAVLEHVRRCWASLFSERAVAYRARNGFDHRKVQMAVLVQQMVFPSSAGTMFTADPISGNRRIVSVEATLGLGEALVSGLVNPDVFKVLDGQVVEKTARQQQPTLSDRQVIRLAGLGRRIEAHFGRPQDVEWCLVDDDFYIVQSRPITTLFPIPAAAGGENRVYLSVGHQQMMTDPMKPLGISMWQLTAGRPMYEAGGRLFVDVTEILASPRSRAGFLELAGRSDPLMRDALETIIERDFVRTVPDGAPVGPPGGEPSPAVEPDPTVVTDLIQRTQASIAALKREIAGRSGPALFDYIVEDIKELRRLLFDRRSHQVFMSAMEATWWLNEHLLDWLGESNAADALTQSVPNNVTSEMGLALLDVADVIRPHSDVIAFLQQIEDESFLDELPKVAGGAEARDAIVAFLDRYGMRCVGEIDITKPRWSERPSTIVPIILGNIKNFEPGAGARRFEQGRQEALKKERELLRRLRELPDGEARAQEVKRKIDRVRTFIGYREYPKYAMISRYFVYKLAMLDEAQRLVDARVLRDREDVFFLTFQELHDVVRTQHVDDELIRGRKDAFRSYEALTPPRVLTSDGEVISGTYRRRDLPAGALVGLAVSAGTVEGRARVILDMAEANLEPGDILVTTYTDPSWTPLFVAVRGLVTEVGGQMTHGAVIAREYGLPAVVGVEQATRRIRDGQWIRVNGTAGYVELLQ